MTTYDEARASAIGTKFIDKTDEGIRFIVLRGPMAVCAYAGIPAEHPLAGQDYDCLPVGAHGGLTFAGAGDDKFLPAGFYWYGWDYAHCDDRPFYQDAEMEAKYPSLAAIHTRRWTPEEVEKDSWGALYDIGKLMVLAESIAKRVLGWKQS